MIKDVAAAIVNGLALRGNRCSEWETVNRILMAHAAGDLTLPADNTELDRIAEADLEPWMVAITQRRHPEVML